MEYERLEPWGAWRDNFHAAMVACIFANAHRDPKKRAIPMDAFFYKDPETAAQERDKETLKWFESKVKHD